MSDYNGAAPIYPMLPEAETLIADKGYDSDAFREALAGRRITPCIPPRAKRRLPATYRNTLYRQPHKVENTFAKLKDCRLSQCVTTAEPTHSSALSASP
jgi:transposase